MRQAPTKVVISKGFHAVTFKIANDPRIEGALLRFRVDSDAPGFRDRTVSFTVTPKRSLDLHNADPPASHLALGALALIGEFMVIFGAVAVYKGAWSFS